jgi:hypothetical protein
MKLADTRAVLLRRRGLVFVEGGGAASVPKQHLEALEIEWAALGYVPSTRLRSRLAQLSRAELGEIHHWVHGVLARQLGAHRKHVPLFRSFPDGIPDDTTELWVRKVVSLFLQDIDQPCLFCGAVGTTHVLDPCLDVVCDRCFDGASYSACPVCERKVDRSSPFFRPSPERKLPASEQVTLKRLDLGDDPEAQTRALFLSFCQRTQAMSPNDRTDLETIVLELGDTVLGWLPEKIPVKENVALVFGTLFTVVDPAIVLPVAQRYLKTATDVLRFLAVLSGADASLQPEKRYKGIVNRKYVYQNVRRFRMARLGRPLRRALLALMEGFGEEALTEDMLRHQSLWVWAGEFLHPHEYAKRFPKVAQAFQVVRKFAPDGTPAPAFAGFKARLEAAAAANDAPAMVRLLRDRPGELGRRFDHALRVAGEDGHAVDEVVRAFQGAAPRLSTPLLLTLYRFLPARVRRVQRRVYWPKGAVTTGFWAPDERKPLTADAIGAAMNAVTAELLRRFAEKPALDTIVIDRALRQIMVPFNERTAARSAVALPRGSVVPVPRDKIVRMFLHWCQPEKDRSSTDIDLSVGFYTNTWKEAGVCSYYQLKLVDGQKQVIAVSGGDCRSAPFPDGASELVDVHWENALAAGARYAVMVVNNYAGLPFSQLERGFAGLMLRDDAGGQHFDPRTVELKFDLQGENGVYMPLVLDLQENVLHWLDVYATGELVFNNVATSRRAITSICPTLMEYFASGIRPSMYELALLHAAARARTVLVRGSKVRRFQRGDGEDVATFHARLARDEGGEQIGFAIGKGRTLAVLYRGDVELPEGTERYVLFPEQVAATISASDLLA